MMRFRTNTTLEIIENYDEENDVVDSVEETFKQGEIVDADIFGEDGEMCDIQFGDGSVAYGVIKADIEEI